MPLFETTSHALRSLTTRLAGAVAVTALCLAVAAPASAATNPTGPDVSRWQHGAPLSWTAVKASGHSFAFVKATEGLTFKDPEFERNRSALEGTPLRWGAYHYYLPQDSGKEQANYFLKTVGVDNLKKHLLPPVLDVEEWNKESTQELINGVQTWLDTVEAAIGRKPIVYTYHEFWTAHLNRGFQDYPLWLAGPLEESVTWSFWQMGNQGQVAGIAGCVDQDMFRGTLEELDAFILTGKLPVTALQPPATSAHCSQQATDGGTPSHDAGTHDAGTPGSKDAGTPASRDAGTADAGQPVPRQFQSWMTPNPARQVSGPKLVFPTLTTRVGVRGDTTVRCTIQTTGSLKDCVITQPLGPSSVSAYLEMDVAILDMLNASTFEPVKANGQVVEVDYDFRMYIDAGQYTWSWL